MDKEPESWILMTKQQKGLENAIKNELPHVEHKLTCLRRPAVAASSQPAVTSSSQPATSTQPRAINQPATASCQPVAAVPRTASI
ncbi:hypothetical protein LIER_06295 [Lithospermum erythrorhizon]|uniref:Uncharacterized protein n=1 Tax=Lithospermum erythrorhizon TaxID=34254 RepID=A0AAV3P413_LITER